MERMIKKTKEQNVPKGEDLSKISLSTSILNSFAAGAFSGTCSTILLQPLDLIKTRVQQRPHESIWTISRHIAKTEGVTGFWTGVTPSLWRTVPGIGLYFACYHSMSSWISSTDSMTSVQSLIVGTMSRVFAGTILIPMTVIKTRWEAGGNMFQYRGQGILSAFKSIVKLEGARGLASGIVPTIVRDAPYSGIYLLFYNKFKQMSSVTEILDMNTRSIVQFSCGILAGAVATVIVQPADVVKTELQLKQQRVSQWSVIQQIHSERGFRGFFVGLVPRVVRKSLMSALAWTVYERVTQQMFYKL